jgi:hypothetical protein
MVLIEFFLEWGEDGAGGAPRALLKTGAAPIDAL